ncbi:glycosyltransferase family 2 protein [Thermosynechococcus sichuanensis E542]|uniref:Glycosyltransferase family 2 protein n=1 Tax=Thermosynechococcus sichuanensis E542 TaxID=2016101 RepID=A0A3B7MEY2_9CYAN|nr:glycosyltransferase family A protein [Thermosynechococcus vestitus]AXY68155.1 glycosyltransferase family 2 protein [Thermosynechococcus vestitus E542]
MTEGLAVELAGLRSFSIVMPAYNVVTQRGETVFRETLESIAASCRYLQQHFPYATEGELILISDGSTDTTCDVATEGWPNTVPLQLVGLPTNIGIAAARNMGVRLAKGEVIFFCDADDLYRPEHLFLALSVLNQPLPQPYAPGYFGAVRTGVYCRDRLHPYWHRSLEQTLVLNLAVRREVHEFIGGFPEEEVFRQFRYGAEDVAYAHWLHRFCHTARLEQQTVEYRRFPDSFFDRQLKKFQAAPGTVADDLDASDRQQEAQIQQIMATRLQELQAKAAQLVA